MATPSEVKHDKGVGGSSHSKAAEEESHVSSFSPMMMATYKRTLDLVLTAPWEGICKHRTCECDPPLPIKLTISWDSWNRGRRVFKCANSAEHGCGYECFVCRAILGPDPQTIDFLYDRVKRLIAANVVLRAKLAALDNAANTLWVKDDPPIFFTSSNIIDDMDIFTYDEVLDELYRPNTVSKKTLEMGCDRISS